MKKLHFWPIAWTLAIFLSLVYTLDVLAGLLFPNWYVMQKFWEFILPSYTFISWGAFFTGLVEIFVGGILTAVLFVPVYNFFAGREVANQAPAITTTSQHT
jgi:hypothetical protein